MKVQCLNSSSIKTRNLIKKTLAELVNEKKQLSKVTVTELVKRAEITRSTFYTHYDNIADVAQDYQMQTIELLCSDELKLHSKEDIEKYFDNIIACIKENEKIYRLLISTNETYLFLEKLKKIANDKIYDALKNKTLDKYLELNISFFTNGIVVALIEYLRGYSKYSLDDLLINMKIWFDKLF